MTATGPSGCQTSMSRWPGRSDAIVRPKSWRDRPTARSQMSIISWTSPRPSLRIFPASRLTRRPKRLLVPPQRLAVAAHELTALRRRHDPPALEGSQREADRLLEGQGIVVEDGADDAPVDRGPHVLAAGVGQVRVQAHLDEELRLLGSCVPFSQKGRRTRPAARSPRRRPRRRPVGTVQMRRSAGDRPVLAPGDGRGLLRRLPAAPLAGDRAAGHRGVGRPRGRAGRGGGGLPGGRAGGRRVVRRRLPRSASG